MSGLKEDDRHDDSCNVLDTLRHPDLISSNEIPPPMANLTYPPSNRDELQFNFLDSFATSWVTPEFSKEPCFLSLYYWNSSATEPWTNSGSSHAHRDSDFRRLTSSIRVQPQHSAEWHGNSVVEDDWLRWSWPAELELCGPGWWPQESHRRHLPHQS